MPTPYYKVVLRVKVTLKGGGYIPMSKAYGNTETLHEDYKDAVGELNSLGESGYFARLDVCALYPDNDEGYSRRYKPGETVALDKAKDELQHMHYRWLMGEEVRF
jgi:hypothetical protein